MAQTLEQQTHRCPSLGVIANFNEQYCRFESKLAPIGQLNASNALSQIHSDLQGELLHAGADDGHHPVMGRDISGGYIGALQFAFLLMLFGDRGQVDCNCHAVYQLHADHQPVLC